MAKRRKKRAAEQIGLPPADAHHFDFDLDRGIRIQVVEKLEASPLLPLTKGVAPTLSGIYALNFQG